MKLISVERIEKDFSDYPAIFFMNDEIIVDCLTTSPIQHFSKTNEKLCLIVNAVYIDEAVLVVQCESVGKLDQSFESEYRLHPIKLLLTETNEENQQRILRATHWLTWDARLQYCSRCGSKVYKVLDLLEKKCASCEFSFFPNLSPAIMVLIQRGDEILLARSAHFKPGRYSALAGFVDIGESAEDAVHREVKEEVGIEISQLEYFGSQSWPFPSSFMIAYKAQYLRGEIKIDINEIEDARWYHINNLPDIPPYPSISRALIDSVHGKETHS